MLCCASPKHAEAKRATPTPAEGTPPPTAEAPDQGSAETPPAPIGVDSSSAAAAKPVELDGPNPKNKRMLAYMKQKSGDGAFARLSRC